MICLVDNSSKVFSLHEVADLLPITNKSIQSLCQNKNLLIFPQSFSDTADKIGEQCILNSVVDEDFVNLFAGNILGFIGNKNVKLKIRSRFDYNQQDFFLHYMLQKVFSFSVFDLNHTYNNTDIFDFLLFLFPRFLANAMNLGIYKEYKRIDHNDANVKGLINVAAHIRQNIPTNGYIAYTNREYTLDNNMNQLIRHTIEYIKTKHFGKDILQIDKTTIDNVNTICQITPSYRQANKMTIISNNLRPKIHPYFTEYKPLQQLCIQILRMEEMKYGDNEDEIFGILFDGAWLWEEYVNTLLEPLGFLHPLNKQGSGTKYLFLDNTGRRYPDFYMNNYVADAKYKKYGDKERVSQIQRDDMHQIITYMYILKAEHGIFIVPYEGEKVKKTSCLHGYGGDVSIVSLTIPTDCSSYKDFCNKIKSYEEIFCRNILS